MSLESSLMTGIITAIFMSIFMSILGLWCLKTHKIEDILVNSMETLIEEVTNDVELQKRVYTFGALIGNGAKGGLGLNPRGGKLRLEDIIVGALGQFLGVNKNEPSNSGGAPP